MESRMLSLIQVANNINKWNTVQGELSQSSKGGAAVVDVSVSVITPRPYLMTCRHHLLLLRLA
jgi:hypothetical protein